MERQITLGKSEQVLFVMKIFTNFSVFFKEPTLKLELIYVVITDGHFKILAKTFRVIINNFASTLTPTLFI